ncbi:MAG: hypothetical protein GY725_17085, partial [bacterium]|nr:hypothetical protein [bacterium]
RGQARRKDTMTGALLITGDIPRIWPLLAMGEQCHLGRGAVEGLGAFRLEGQGQPLCQPLEPRS